jgi:hypothetical protein
MERILFIVIWFFTFAFLAGIISILLAVGFSIAGLDSWSDFLMDKLLRFIIPAAPITGLILGLLGYLPGTKEQKVFLPTTKNDSHWATKVVQYVILRIGLNVYFPSELFLDNRQRQ